MHKGSLNLKLQKGNFRNKELSINNSSVIFGDLGIKLYQKGILRFSQINAAKKILAKALKGIGKL
jgi:ribosomal protein L16/L10AE